MEVVATILAVFVGVMALVRFYTRKANVFFVYRYRFLGHGFAGRLSRSRHLSVFCRPIPIPPAFADPMELGRLTHVSIDIHVVKVGVLETGERDGKAE